MDREQKILSLVYDTFSLERFWANLYVCYAKQTFSQNEAARSSFSGFGDELKKWIATQDDSTRVMATRFVAFVNSPAWPTDD